MWDTEFSDTDTIAKIPATGQSSSSKRTDKTTNKYNELTVGVGIKF